MIKGPHDKLLENAAAILEDGGEALVIACAPELAKTIGSATLPSFVEEGSAVELGLPTTDERGHSLETKPQEEQ
jgi:hypothetical protein